MLAATRIFFFTAIIMPHLAAQIIMNEMRHLERTGKNSNPVTEIIGNLSLYSEISAR